MPTYSEFECIMNKCYLTMYNLDNAIRIGRDKYGDIAIMIDSRKIDDKELVEIVNNLIDYFREKGATILLTNRIEKKIENEEFIIYALVEAVLDSGIIIRIAVR